MVVKRALTTEVQTEVAIDFTRPVFLVEMQFPSGTVYLSSGPQITYDSNVYQEGQVSVGSFTWNSDGTQQGTIVLSNENNAASALILNGTVNDVVINIYKTYLKSSGSGPTVEAVAYNSSTLWQHLSAIGGPLFNVDGTRPYTIRDDGATSQIAKLASGSAWAAPYVPEASSSLSVILSRGGNRLRDVVFGENGDSFIGVELGTDTIAKWTKSTGASYDIDTLVSATPTQTFSVSPVDPRSIEVKADGKKMWYVSNTTGRDLYEVNLGTAWDLTTASMGNSFAPTEGDMVYHKMSADGTRMWMLGLDEILYQYDLSTPYDITTAGTATASLDVGVNVTTGDGVVSFTFDPSGNLLVLEYDTVTSTNGRIQYYPLSGATLNTTPVLYVTGSMDGSNVDYDRSSVGVLSTTAQTGFVPNRYFTQANGFNWLPIEGEKITWGDEVFILQEANN
jgi:hypothetical protein